MNGLSTLVETMKISYMQSENFEHRIAFVVLFMVLINEEGLDMQVLLI